MHNQKLESRFPISSSDFNKKNNDDADTRS